MGEHMFDEEIFDSPVVSCDQLKLTELERPLVDIPPESPSVPSDLGEMVPGPVLAAFLSVVDPAVLSGHDRVLALRAHQRMVSHYQSMLLRDVASVSDAYLEEAGYDHETANDATIMEIRAGLRLTRRSAQLKVDFADAVNRRLPRLGAAMATGSLDTARARVITHGTDHLNTADARQIVDRVIDTAPRLTTGQLAARVRRLCMAIEPEEAKSRYEHAVEQRRLVREATVDGTAHLTIFDGPPNQTGEAYARVDHIARSLRGPGETRTLDQLRADVALDLLIGRSDSKTTGRGSVTIHADLGTLTELAEDPGELAGYGPVVADIARQVAAAQSNTEWRYKITDPATGMPVAVGTTKRRPNTEQARYVELRDPTCVFPGCRIPAPECDLDHIDPWEQTHKTTVLSLGPGCRHDHVRRHRYGWTYAPLPGGDYLWTSPLGHNYTTSGRSPPKTG